MALAEQSSTSLKMTNLKFCSCDGCIYTCTSVMILKVMQKGTYGNHMCTPFHGQLERLPFIESCMTNCNSNQFMSVI